MLQLCPRLVRCVLMCCEIGSESIGSCARFNGAHSGVHSWKFDELATVISARALKRDTRLGRFVASLQMGATSAKVRLSDLGLTFMCPLAGRQLCGSALGRCHRRRIVQMEAIARTSASAPRICSWIRNGKPITLVHLRQSVGNSSGQQIDYTKS